MGMPSYDAIVAVAAYTRENLVAGRDVVVYYRGRTADGVLHMPYRAAPLEAETMRAWR